MDDRESAAIFEIVRMSTEDGPGIRTTVFFKGCPLSCAWCHNPESISPDFQVVWLENRCIGCRTCVDVCEKGALSLTPSGIRIDRDLCVSCGRCASECPATALEFIGKKWSLDDLIAEVMKDRAYFNASDGGGVTASGGEPTLQAGFVARFFEKLRRHGIHTALDTCGFTGKKALELILPHTALVMLDIKLMDKKAHLAFCGADNAVILENTRFIAAYIKDHLYPLELWIRTPLIPGATAFAENIDAIGRFIAEELPCRVSRWELCAFNNLCRDKYLRLGKKWDFDKTPMMTADELAEMEEAARASGVVPETVLVTGSSRMEEDDTERDEAVRKGQQAPSCTIPRKPGP